MADMQTTAQVLSKEDVHRRISAVAAELHEFAHTSMGPLGRATLRQQNAMAPDAAFATKTAERWLQHWRLM
ncbi:hypothetical protein ATCC90586_011628 [Pythium insidiosum]|nr:hypothetical protein ATCC90586_011628 [Pythium insidiosum]